MRLAALLVAALAAVPAFAADVTGKWKATAAGPDGQNMEIVFDLKLEAGKLTGTATTPMGEIPISNATLDGTAISFDVDAGGFKVVHKGTVSNDSMKLTVTFGDSGMPPMEMTASRQPAAK
jgi:hypothetical protein